MTVPTELPALPSVAEIRARTLQHLGRRPCLWQCDIVQAILRRTHDIVSVSATGSGKTLTFWMPLLFRADGIQVIITPLNILGDQNTKQLERLGIRAITITSKTATAKNFQDIGELQYRVIVVNPEEAFRSRGGFSKLWRDATFTARLISVVFDEAHCIHSWASFRKAYGEADYVV